MALIQWTRNETAVSGSIDATILKKPEGSGVESVHTGFTGTVNGNGVTLTTQSPLFGTSQALTGQIEGSGFSLSLPGINHGVITVPFSPASPESYNAAVRELELSPYGESCAMRAEGREAEVDAQGPTAPELCSSLANHKVDEQTWELSTESVGQRAEVCEVERSKTTAMVRDEGGQEIGKSVCNTLLGEGWTLSKAFEEAKSKEEAANARRETAEQQKQTGEEHAREAEQNREQKQRESEQAKEQQERSAEQAKERRERESEQRKEQQEREAEQRERERE